MRLEWVEWSGWVGCLDPDGITWSVEIWILDLELELKLEDPCLGV